MKLLPMIFDDVEQKGWRDHNGQGEDFEGQISYSVDNSNIDASIVLTFLNEFFMPPEEGEEAVPTDVRLLFVVQ